MTTTTQDDEVLPTQLTAATPTTGGTEVLGTQLPRTGLEEGMVLVGLLLVATGLALQLVAWRRQVVP